MPNQSKSGPLRYLLLFVTGLAILAIVAILIVSLFRIPVSLTQYKAPLLSALGTALGRSVNIDGDITVTTSLWPYFEIEGLRIANPHGHAPGEIATMEQARITIGLLPLLQRRIRVREFYVSGLSLELTRDAGGRGNWVLETPDIQSPDALEPNQPGGAQPAIRPDMLTVDQLLMENIKVSFQDGEKEPLKFLMERAEGTAPLDEPMSLSMQGRLLEEDFTLDMEASSLADFLAMTHSQLKFQLDIAGTRFAFSGLSDALRGDRNTELQMAISGARLDSMNKLLRIDLPPLEDYELKAALLAQPHRLELTALQASVKQSKLVGRMLLERSGQRPMATLELEAKMIQLQDFKTDGWSPENGSATSTEPEADSEPAPESDDDAQWDKLFSPEVLGRADAQLTIRVDEVRSGADRLGSGKLQITLKNGRIDLDPLQLELPQASLQAQASLKPGRETSDAYLRLLIENFDFGVLTRISNPDSDVGGTLSVDIDVTTSASNTHNILSGASGYMDISGHPENFRSGLVDLWAVNLLSAVVTSSAEDEDISEINCLISRSKLTNGLMVAEQLAADTSKIRICGTGNVNFVDQTFDLVVSPSPKRPEFFSLATPLAVKGDFDDFRIGMKAGALTLGTTAVHFAISPVTVPFKRIFKKDLPHDGADICSLPIGPRQQPLEPLPGC